ncbi:MAG: hypothetical protein KAH23_00545 [Kiritimatiellae bacterium]|nr:hypothetical protein [Kiritimatiellia bacterium]
MSSSGSRNDEPDSDEAVLTTPDGHALPRVLDRSVTMDLVQTYVESERIRSRRALLWVSTIFLFVVLLVLSIFVAVSVHVMKNSQQVTQNMTKVTSRIDTVRLETAAYAAEVIDMTNRIDTVENANDEISGEVKNHEASRARKERVLWRNLTNFSNWVVERDEDGLKYVSRIEARLKELEGTAAARQMELVAVRQEYSTMLTKMTDQNSKAGGFRENVSEDRRTVYPSLAESPQYANFASPDDADDGSDIDALAGYERGRPKGEISVVTFPNGDKYEGEFKNGLFHGWGTFHYLNGDKYEGPFKNDEKYGRGSFVYRNGDRYDGEFRNNVKEGRGKLLLRNGDRYVGDFRNDGIKGKGTYFYKNKNKYTGDFKNGFKHGNGGFIFANGDKYEGEFRDDKRHGKGTYTFGDGGRYIGEFKDGKRHGDGRYIYPDGKEYKGEFKAGKKEGRGMCIYPNGKRLKGIWRNDKLVKRMG